MQVPFEEVTGGTRAGTAYIHISKKILYIVAGALVKRIT
jgi:hypothetical protein